MTMLRIPVRSSVLHKNPWIRYNSSSNSIRNTFIEYFQESHGHQHIKSSSVVSLCDPTVPFVNAGMNQFKGVFLGQVESPCARAVNSQKCVRVGGKHNDLEVVGTDGTHHTFFEMLGNWSFGDYYKKEACRMAWDLLGVYRLRPEDLVVTYFAGDSSTGLLEDRECRDIWQDIGVPTSRLKALGAKDNFWEMGASGPCGPCTEIHYVNPDGSLTEIWNLVFIQYNRESDGTVTLLPRRHVDTGMGLERMAALLQGVPSNYDTDLFQPIIKAIEKNSKGVAPYGGSYAKDAILDNAYRRLADHARMVSVCLADGAFPSVSLNLKQIMRKSYKLSADVFSNPHLLSSLYSEVARLLGPTYPELISKEADARLILDHEEQLYAKMRSQMAKKWKELALKHPEVEEMADVEFSGFVQGYREFKETMNKQNSTVIPGELVFKLYDTHGFQEDIIQRIAELNNLTIDNEGFGRLLTQHKSRHKTALKEQTSNKAQLYNSAIETLIKTGFKSTNDQHKYSYKTIGNNVTFEPLKTKLVAILNEDCVSIDSINPCENRTYYLVTEDTNFYCEEGGQAADTGAIRLNEKVTMNVDSVFKIRDFVFHKGSVSSESVIKCNSEVILEVDSERRSKIMVNHTALHLLNAAIRKVLPNSVVYQIGSKVTDKELRLNLSVYGDKLTQEVVLKAQDLVRESIKANAPVETRVLAGVQEARAAGALAVPGEAYPAHGLRLVGVAHPLPSKELCCGTHAAVTGALRDFCVTLVKGAGTRAPAVRALTGDAATQARELFCRADKLSEVIHLVEPSRRKQEVSRMRQQLSVLCGTGGAPSGDYRHCVQLLDSLAHAPSPPADMADEALQSVANAEVQEAVTQALREGRGFVVYFLRCSYLMRARAVAEALAASRARAPALLLGCAGGVLAAGCSVPQEFITEEFTASRWLSCILPVFHADIAPARPGQSPHTYAEMTETKVSLINCEQLVQDAMRAAVKYAKSHVHTASPSQNRQHN